MCLPSLRGQFVFERVVSCVLACKAKAHSPWPIIDLIKGISPAHSVANFICASGYARPVVDIIRRTQIYAFIETGHDFHNRVLIDTRTDD